MILSNIEILKGIKSGSFSISPLAGNDPSKSPFNTSAVDLRLGNEITIPRDDAVPLSLDLSKSGIAQLINQHSETITITNTHPYSLEPKKLILANTLEFVDFPISKGAKKLSYSARVEGKSSWARCGILIHFTAPTIHAGFNGKITLEIINLGVHTFLLKPGMFACQLIIEEIKGNPVNAPNQFKGQTRPSGK